MLPEQQQRIVGYFIEEAKDHLNTIEQGLLSLQNTIDDPEMLREVYRAAHSVKGGAGMLGFKSIQKTAHLLEDCFKILEGSPVQVDQKLESLFLRVFDALQSLVEQLQGPFGLTDDVAASLMSEVEPVFTELEQYLEALVKHPAGSAKAATPAAAKGRESLLAEFKQEVMEQLRQMLQLFKPPQWPNSRQQIVACCTSLQQQGDALNLPAWSHVLEMAKNAIANPDNGAQTLAPIVIKEIKQAQDLVLANRGHQISISDSLLALQPPAPQPEAAVESELEDLLAIAEGSDDDLDWLRADGSLEENLEPASATNVPLYQAEGIEDFSFEDVAAEAEPEFPEFWAAEEEATPVGTPSSFDSPIAWNQPNEDQDQCVIIAADPIEPEVGMAELNSLADLFEDEDVQELDSRWHIEELIGDATNESFPQNSDNFNARSNHEFADLFEDNSSELPDTDTPEDDTVTLFGKAFLDEDTVQELTKSPTNDPADDEFADLLEDDSPEFPEAKASAFDTATLFGQALLEDETPQDSALPQLDGLTDDEFADLFEDDSPEQIAASSSPEEPLGLFGDEFLFEDGDSESVGSGLPAAATAEPEADNLSALFADLNENDLWQETVPDDQEASGAAFQAGENLEDASDDNWLPDWEQQAVSAIESPIESELIGVDPDAIADFPGEFSAAELGSEEPDSSLAFGDIDFSFNPSAGDEEAALLGDESNPAAVEAMDLSWENSANLDAEALDFAALTDDFEPSSLFAQEVATQTPAPSVDGFGLSNREAAQASKPPTAPEATFDDFFSLDGEDQLGEEQPEAPATSALDENWLGGAEDLFADMESPVSSLSQEPEEESQPLMSGFGSEASFDLFGEESSESFDLFGGETPGLEDEPVAASTSPSDDWFSFDVPQPDNAEIAGDQGLEWFSDMIQDAETGMELPATGVGDEAIAGLDLSDDLGDFGDLSAEEAPFSLEQFDLEATTAEAALEGDVDFADLEALLGDEDLAAAATAESAAAAASEDLDFDALEALLGEETPPKSVSTPAAKPATPAPTKAPTPSAAPKAKADKEDFDDLEEMLASAENLGGPPAKPRPGQAAVTKPRGTRIFEQTMKVPVKQLDNLTNLVGELVVNRNSLEQDHERLRQFLENLLHQVQQLSDVGARMQDLYERSLLESALLASRQSYRFSSSSSDSSSSNGYSSSPWNFEHIEMDRFTPFHTLSQEMIELIVRVRESSSDIEFIVDETEQVSRQFRQVSTQLQEGLTRARMVPFAEIERVFPLFRYVRDKASELGKQAELRIEGRETLIDKLILEHLSDPLKHLINNALAHGIESPEVRQGRGKPPVGRITLSAFHQGNQTVISFADDGAGIDLERLKVKAVEKRLITASQAKALSRIDAYELLYLPGLSTKDQADLLAGKGVGMDVVRTNVSEIRGTITTDSTTGKGTTFTIRLPLTLSICKALCCVSDKARIAFPMDGVEDALDIPKERVQVNANGDRFINWRDMQLPFRHLNELLGYNRQLGRGRVYGANKEEDSVAMIVLRSAGNFLALQVDQVLGEQEIVIKQLEGPVPKPIGIAGATVMGDGRIMPIGDVLELIDVAQGRVRKDHGGTLWENTNIQAVAEPSVTEPRVLIVDDSITVRELLSMTFNKAGYRVEQARDGQEAWDKLKSGLPCDIVFCDIEMPRMDGLELLSRLNKDSDLTHLPVAMLTSRGAEKHRQMAFELGASGYFTKPYLEEALLDAASRMLRGEKLVTSSVSVST